jgi:hypothetical protein
MIDLLTEQTQWETRQIDKRVVSMIRQKYSLNEEQLLSRILHGHQLGTYQMSADEQAEVSAYQYHAEAARVIGRQAKADNALLGEILAYEQAVRDVAELSLLIEGRAEVPAVEEVSEELDPETGEVLVEYVAPVAAIPAIEPLTQTVEQTDEEGVTTTVPNPAYVEATEALQAAQAVIDNVKPEVLVWVEQRQSA